MRGGGGTLDELTRANAAYVASLYEDYQRAPRSVDERWALRFAGDDYGRGGEAPAAEDPVRMTLDA